MPEDTAQLDSITLDEMRALWPKSGEGAFCARLLQRFMLTRMVESAVGADCNPVSAPAEAAANKAHAKLLKEFGTLTIAPPPPKERQPMAHLHRFDSPKKTQPQPQPQTP